MAVLAQNLSHSVAVVRRKLLQMMDALAESGMRHAHSEIVRAHESSGRKDKTSGKRKKRKSGAMH